MIFYITKDEMVSKWKKNYFGLTAYKAAGDADIYIQKDIPECVQKSVLAHEKYHARNGAGSSEIGANFAGLKGNWKGFLLGIVLSLRWSRIKMYPELTSAILLIIGFSLLIYFND
jgi:hypothetical protein